MPIVQPIGTRMRARATYGMHAVRPSHARRAPACTGRPRAIPVLRRARRAAACLAALAGLLHAAAAGAAGPWYPVTVDVWDPPFNESRQRVQREYVPVERAAKPWRICASIPHLKDAFWVSVNHGLVEEARRLGVALSLHQSGGYEFLDVQRAQLDACLADGVDGLIVSAVSLDGVNDLVARAADMGVPVVDLINGMSSPAIAARAAPSYWINAHTTGTYLRRLQAEAGRPIRVAWFPGPEGAAWVRDADAGFRAALEGAPVEIVATRFGDTGRAAQALLVEAALDEHPDGLDYLVGTAPTAEAAGSILRGRGLAGRVRVMAFYFSPGVYRGIRRGEIVAAPADGQGLVSRIAVDLMVRILEQRDHVRHVAPIATVVDVDNVRGWDSSATLAPRGFRPVFRVNAP